MIRYALLLILAGCGTTPNELTQSSQRTTHNLVNPPAIAAGCMARNIENHQSGFVASVRQLDANRMELVVRVTVEHVFAVVHVAPSGKGSMATVYQREQRWYRMEQFVPILTKGC